MKDEYVSVRIPSELKNKLKKEAKKENRTMCGQIVHILDQHFSRGSIAYTGPLYKSEHKI